MRFIITLLALLVGVVPAHCETVQGPGSVAERDPQSYGSFEVHRSFALKAPDGEVELPGLYLLRIRPLSDTTRVLVTTPTGRHIVLTSTLNVGTGRLTSEVLDDATGWWARVTLETGVVARTLFLYYRVYETVHPVDGGTEVDLRFETADGFVFETAIPAHESITERQNLAIERLSAAGRLVELSDGVPPELRQALLFLDASLSPVVDPEDFDQSLAYSLRGPLTLLAGALRYAPPGGETASVKTWRMVVEPTEKGHGPWTPEELELFSGFRTVSAESFLPAEPYPDEAPGEEVDDPAGRKPIQQ